MVNSCAAGSVEIAGYTEGEPNCNSPFAGNAAVAGELRSGRERVDPR